MDRCIYQYYAYLLNVEYNKFTVEEDINTCSIAYRNNLGKNNIYFSKQAFDFIKKLDACYVIVGDFKSFFDNLDHKYLKEKLCSLLKVERLPDDYYAIYKNITKYAEVLIDELLLDKGFTKRGKDLKEFNKKSRIYLAKQFRTLKKEHKTLISTNRSAIGIPQGSAISAVFANIYMMDFDRVVHEFVLKQKGLFMRYSDDFIIVLHKYSDSMFREQYEKIRSFIRKIPNLILESNKTQIYSYDSGVLMNCSENYGAGGTKTKHCIDYLGFSFDGRGVRIRDKTLSKYYRKMYAKIKTIGRHNGVSPKKHKISGRVLYDKFSIKGSMAVNRSDHEKNLKCNEKARSNFIDYCLNAAKIYQDEPEINQVVKKHMQKIKSRLNRELHYVNR